MQLCVGIPGNSWNWSFQEREQTNFLGALTVEPFGRSMRPEKKEFSAKGPSSNLPLASRFCAWEVAAAARENKEIRKSPRFMDAGRIVAERGRKAKYRGRALLTGWGSYFVPFNSLS